MIHATTPRMISRSFGPYYPSGKCFKGSDGITYQYATIVDKHGELKSFLIWKKDPKNYASVPRTS